METTYPTGKIQRGSGFYHCYRGGDNEDDTIFFQSVAGTRECEYRKAELAGVTAVTVLEPDGKNRTGQLEK